MKYVLEVFLDTISLAPFLFLSFLMIEYFEHHSSDKLRLSLGKSQKSQPLIATITGIIPSCGIPIVATNLFVNRLISLGSLIAIYLATFDEAFLLILAAGEFLLIFKLIVIKLTVALGFGYLIDFLFRQQTNYQLNQNEHLNCDENIFVEAFSHSLQLLLLVLLINFLLGYLVDFLDFDSLGPLFQSDSLLQPILSAFIGLLPHCAISILFVRLYQNDVLSFSALVAGLLSTTGSSLIVLMRSKTKTQKKFLVIMVLFLCSSLSGLILSLILR